MIEVSVCECCCFCSLYVASSITCAKIPIGWLKERPSEVAHGWQAVKVEFLRMRSSREGVNRNRLLPSVLQCEEPIESVLARLATSIGSLVPSRRRYVTP